MKRDASCSIESGEYQQLCLANPITFHVSLITTRLI